MPFMKSKAGIDSNDKFLGGLNFPQLTSKTLCEQQEQLKKMESISALQENNRMLKMDRDKLELELQQAQAKVRTKH